MSKPKTPEGETDHEAKANVQEILIEELQKRRLPHQQKEHIPQPHAGRLAAVIHSPMPCFYPLTGWRSRESGKLTTSRSEGYTDKPMTVACGNCIGCRLELTRQWGVRCMHEAQMHHANSFLTLTYSDDNLPADRSLNKKHWQDFAKRLRKLSPFRYYHCGEYGEGTLRPHGHALIFGLDWRSSRTFLKMSGQHKLYRSDALDKLWGHGYVNIGQLTQHSATYVVRYSMKALGTDKQLPEDFYGERLDPDTGELSPYRLKPYATMSRNPGLGTSWIEKYYSDVYPSDTVIANGKKSRPPAFYDKYLEEKDPALFEQIKKERIAHGDSHKHNSTVDRLEVRAEIAHRTQLRRQRQN